MIMITVTADNSSHTLVYSQLGILWHTDLIMELAYTKHHHVSLNIA